jgi:MFS family permease
MTETPSPEPQPDAGWYHPAGRAYRFTILFFAGFMIYGSYFAYDAIGAIVDALMADLGIGQREIGTLYTLYSLGPMLFLFAAGMLIDRVGTRKASLIFSGAITLGAILVAVPNLWVMYAGRIIFGFGSEALIVAQSAILARWFKGKELALAFGVALTISRLGTLFSFNTEALIAERLGPFAALWVAAALCGASMLSNLAYVIMDRRAQATLQLKDEEAGDKIVLGQIKTLGPSFWYVTALCVTFYSAIFPFTALSTDMFHEKWQLPLTATGGGGFFSEVFSNFWNMFSTAPGTTSIIIFASMVFAPFAGRLVDRVGRRASMMMVGSLLMVPCHLLLGFSELQPLYPMIVLGAAFVLVPAAMWPSVPLLVDKRVVGTAFGVMTQIQNIGLFLFPYLNGRLREATEDYGASMLMFAGLGGVGFVFALLLARADRLAGGTLRRP